MNLKTKTIKGVAWNGVGNVASQLLRMLTLMIMVRLLTPEDYGLYAILGVFVGFFGVLSNMGISQTVIFLDNPSERMLSTIFILNLAVGVFWYSVLYVIAIPAAVFFENEAIIDLLRVISAIFVIGAFNLVQDALLQKGLEFNVVVTRDLVSQMASAVVGISMALQNYGVYSLVGSALSGACVKTILLWTMTAWKPSLQFSYSDIRHVWKYCINLTGFTVINYFARNSDNFLIGKFIGTAGLGVYNVAYNIMLYPLNNVADVILRVLFPALSSIKSDLVALKRTYIKVICFIALVTFPMMFGLLAVAEGFVFVFFGEKWADLIPLLQVLALVGMVQSIISSVGVIFTALGTTNLMLRIGSMNAVIIVLSIIVGLPFGVLGVAVSYAIGNVIMLYPNLHYAWNLIGLEVAEGLASLKWFFFASVAMALGVFLLGSFLAQLDLPRFVILFVQVLTGTLIYAMVLMLVSRSQVIEMIREIVPTWQATRDASSA